MKHTTLWIDPAISTCKYTYDDSDGVIVKEIYFSGCTKESCKECKWMSATPRNMILSKTYEILLDTIGRTQSKNSKKIVLSLGGGDLTSNWDGFTEFVARVRSLNLDVHILIRVFLCDLRMTQQMQIWLCNNSENLEITIRDTGYYGNNIWDELPIMEFPLVTDIDFYVKKDRLQDLDNCVSSLLSRGKNVHFVYNDFYRWGENDFNLYFRQMTSLLFHLYRESKIEIINGFDTSSYECRNGIAGFVDLDCKTYLCKKISPEYWSYSTVTNLLEMDYMADSFDCGAKQVYYKKCTIMNTIRDFHDNCLKNIESKYSKK